MWRCEDLSQLYPSGLSYEKLSWGWKHLKWGDITNTLVKLQYSDILITLDRKQKHVFVRPSINWRGITSSLELNSEKVENAMPLQSIAKLRPQHRAESQKKMLRLERPWHLSKVELSIIWVDNWSAVSFTISLNSKCLPQQQTSPSPLRSTVNRRRISENPSKNF